MAFASARKTSGLSLVRPSPTRNLATLPIMVHLPPRTPLRPCLAAGASSRSSPLYYRQFSSIRQEHLSIFCETAPLTWRRCPEKSGCCPEKSGRCPEKSRRCPDKSGRCPEKSGRCPEKSGHCPAKSRHCPAKSRHCPAKSGRSSEK